MVIKGEGVCHTELKEIQIYVKKILDVLVVAGSCVMTGMKKFVENVFHVLILALMVFMKLFRVIHIH